jgi:hypothetical protein
VTKEETGRAVLKMLEIRAQVRRSLGDGYRVTIDDAIATLMAMMRANNYGWSDALQEATGEATNGFGRGMWIAAAVEMLESDAGSQS